MLRIENKANNTETIVLGNHIIMNFTQGYENTYPAPSSWPSIIMNSSSLEYRLNSKDKELGQHLNHVLSHAYENPNKCGVYEDWIGSLKQTNYSPIIVESCARQFKALEHILNEAQSNDLIPTHDVWYMLTRLEFNYRSFLNVCESQGVVEAYRQLEADNRISLSINGDERGFAKESEPIGVDYFRRRLALAGKYATSECYDTAVREIQKGKLAQLIKDMQKTKSKLSLRRTSNKDLERMFRKQIYITYEDIIKYNQMLLE